MFQGDWQGMRIPVLKSIFMWGQFPMGPSDSGDIVLSLLDRQWPGDLPQLVGDDLPGLGGWFQPIPGETAVEVR